jgi:PAS domain S-box-containing protein
MAGASPDVIFRATVDGSFTYVSPVVANVLGCGREALEGEYFGEFVADGSVEDAMAGFAAVVDGEPVDGLRVAVERADGTTVWMEINAVPLTADGRVEEVLGFTRDVTDEGDQGRALAEREEKFRAVFEAALEPMLLADDAGTYVDANPAACELFGLPREELVGRSIDEFAPDDYDFAAAWESFEAAEEARGTFPLVRQDGDRRTVEYASARDVVRGLHLSILRDVTDGSA